MAAATSEKYEKLAAEYAKLKTHIASLKKAYLDEHTECCQIKDQVKEGAQWTRKCEQEVDSLWFRNQQLARRVEVLQEDLDTLETQRSKHRHKGKDGGGLSKVQRSTSVFDEELQGKMEENTRLQAQLQELSVAYEHQVIALEERVKKCDQDHSRQTEVVASLRQTNDADIQHLQQEKATLEEKMWSQENDIRDYRSRAEVAEQELVSVRRSLEEGLTRASAIISTQLPFIDTKHRMLNTLNLPTYDRKHQARARDLIGQAATIVGEVIQGFSKFYTYCEQRCRIYPADGQSESLSPVNKKYCKYLHENMSYLRPVEQSLRLFSEELREESLIVLETASDLQHLAKNFSRLVDYCYKLLPYQILSLEEENRVSTCPSILAAKNGDLQTLLTRCTSTLHKIAAYLTLLSMQSRPTVSHPSCSHGRMFRQLSRSLEQLQEAVREMSKVYNAKVSLEHQLPAATPKLKMIDECVVSSLVSMVTSTAKMSAFMMDNLEFFTASAEVRPSDSSPGSQHGGEGPRYHPQVTEFQHRTASFLTALNARARPDSVPHQTALKNHGVFVMSVERREGLGRQVCVLQERSGRLEQDKEHLVLELQLLKVKYDAERQALAQSPSLSSSHVLVPSLSSPQLLVPSLSSPHVLVPSLSSPHVLVPSLSSPHVLVPSLSSPHVLVPSLSSPHVLVPSLSSPHVLVPSLSSPHVLVPSLSSPHVLVPSLSSPHVLVPSLSSPHVLVPSLSSPHVLVLSPSLSSPHVLVLSPSLSSAHVLVPSLSSPHVLVPSLSSPHVLVPSLSSPHVLVPSLSSPHVLVPSLSSPHMLVLSPSLSSPHVLVPSLSSPHVLVPSLSSPHVLVPSLSSPHVLVPSLSSPHVLVPSLSSPHMLVPSLSSPHVLVPSLSSPHVLVPSLSSPHVLVPSLSSPHVLVPSLSSPHVLVPSLSSPHVLVLSPSLSSPHVLVLSPSLSSPHVLVLSPSLSSAHVLVLSLSSPHVLVPSLSSPHVLVPSLSSPHVLVPSLSSPHVLVLSPSLSSPHVLVLSPSLSSPHVLVPSLSSPHVLVPSLSSHHVLVPSLSSPHVLVPSLSSHHVLVPSLSSPHVLVPSLSSHHMLVPSPSLSSPHVLVLSPSLSSPHVLVLSTSLSSPHVLVPSLSSQC
ncbi:hypothetical protein ACOMHN_003821 [Nucella lapillus]